ncbi:MAG: hypothetical protein ABFC62_06920 [Clostridiaceae bacterium]|nr:hypothetical protein [Eubacteriales bacterium]
MNIDDILVGSAFSVPQQCPDERLLFLGGGYSTVLYAPLPPCMGFRSLREARLVLFKLPVGGTGGCGPRGRYFAYPLLDFTSVCGYAFAPPRIDYALKTEFCDDPQSAALEIDITRIANAWLNGCPENRGLLLTTHEDAPRLAFASDRFEIAGMRPMLRLVSDGIVFCQALSAHECEVTVNG